MRTVVATCIASVASLLAMEILVFADESASHKRYTIYPRLDSAAHDIRILNLDQHWSSIINTTVQPVKFVDLPDYVALSYAWGTKDADKSILINRQSMMVRANLFDALSNLRRWSISSLNLWVDAICIDQANAEEKALQVPMMAFIYRRAREVVIWLGYWHTLPSQLDSFEAGLDHLPAKLSRMRKYEPDKFKEWWHHLESFLYNLIYEEYWKRLWIIQEICLAAKLYVHFGSSSRVSWDAFIELVMLYKEYHVTDRRVDLILSLATTRSDMFRSSEAYTLGTLLNTYKDAFCQDPRDKIYGFLGMANDISGHEIAVTYDESVEESLTYLYADVVRFFNSSPIGVERKKIEMMYLSSLVRRLLTRYAEEVPFALEKQSNTWLGWNFLAEPATRYTMAYLSSLPEQMELEGPDFLYESPNLQGLSLKASIAGTVARLGPPTLDLQSSFSAMRNWRSEVIRHFEGSGSLRHARSQNERLMSVISQQSQDSWQSMKYGVVYHIRSIQSIRSSSSYSKIWSSYRETPPHVFIGSNDFLGLVPSEAQLGDLICQFWNSTASAVVRKTVYGTYKVVGRAAVVQHGEALEWDIPVDQALFVEGGSREVLDLKVDLATLTALSLDTVFLPAYV